MQHTYFIQTTHTKEKKMPIAWVKYDKGKLNCHVIYKMVYDLEANLPRLIAEALNVPSVLGAQLTENDVEARIEPFDALNTKAHKDLEIVIFANYFAERERNLDTERAPYIAKEVKKLIPYGMSGFVYVRLAPSGFAEF